MNEHCAETFTPWDLEAMIHPEIKKYFMMMPGTELTSEILPYVREVMTPPPESLPKDEAVDVHDEILPSGLRVRVYTPATKKAEYPGLLWIHGGGHFSGTPEYTEWLQLAFVKKIGCIVVAPYYRLAPENPYPADVEDCYEALTWMTEKLPVRKDRIAVVGGSAGGGLSAAMTLMARDKKDPEIHFQALFYPQLDCRMDTPSSYQIADNRATGRNICMTALKWYLGDLSGDVPVYASPALEKDLSGLPPAYIMVGGLDPFRDEAITYAQRLMQAGVPVELHVIPGAYHAFDMLIDPAISVKVRNEYINAIKEALN